MQTATLDDFVNRVRSSSDILSVASQYLSFTQKSGRYWACCPFHQEKTPSFTVDPGKGFFHCFGCGAGGNVFNFVSRMENISYFDAVKLQAKRLNIPLPNERPKTDHELELEREKKSLYEINGLARNFFHNCLTMTPYGKPALDYLENRGIDRKTIDEFKIGFAPNGWSKLSSAFEKRGITPNRLIDAGLAVERKRGDGVYDRFRSRVMIPITDLTGHVLAFGGRILEQPSIHVVGSTEKDAPKYLNTPETLVFNKRKVLFGLDRAGPSINREGFVIVVEGYMDAISLASAGIKNVVATLGTAFTADHVKILKRYAKKIVFCYDSDDAGQNATMRALPIITDANAQASVIIIPDSKDPDEYVRKHSREEFWQLALNAMPMIDYRIKYVIERADIQTPAGKLDALREILSSMSKMHDTALRNEYGRQIAAMLSLDLNTVNDEWKKFSSMRETTPSSKPNARVVKIGTVRAEAQNDAIWYSWRNIIKTAWHAEDLLQHALASIPKESFPKVHQEIIDYLEKCSEEERHADDVTAAEELSAPALSELAECLTDSDTELTAEEVRTYMDSLELLRIEVSARQYQKAAQELEQLASDSPEYLTKLKELNDAKRLLDRKRM